jgi:glycosyltransferase involved in cell wall biosynthesis
VKAEGRLAALYICYLTLDDPLVHTQVVAYLAGLAERGHDIHLLTFEPRMTDERRRTLRAEMAALGITWHRLTYHKRPSLPATVFDVAVGAVVGTVLVLRHRLGAVHCRSHVPAATGLVISRLTRKGLIFDIRGQMAEEYEDAGHWKRDGAPFRITKWIEGVAIRKATGIVVLTHKVKQELFGAAGDPRVHVIPCCADLDRITAALPHRDEVRAELGAGEHPVLIFVGKLTGWTMQPEMAQLVAVAREMMPALRFLVLTQGDPEPIVSELTRHGVPGSAVTILRVQHDEVSRYLAAADVAMALIRPSPSRSSASPTKLAEYLGAGLPVITTSGVGDGDQLFAGDEIAVLLDLPVTRQALVEAIDRAFRLAEDAAGATVRRELAARELSLAHRGIPAYAALYDQVARDLRDG